MENNFVHEHLQVTALAILTVVLLKVNLSWSPTWAKFCS